MHRSPLGRALQQVADNGPVRAFEVCSRFAALKDPSPDREPQPSIPQILAKSPPESPSIPCPGVDCGSFQAPGTSSLSGLF